MHPIVDKRQRAMGDQQQQQQTHAQHGSHNTTFATAPSADFVLSGDPSHFAFSAEPASLTDHDPINGATGHDAVFTTNAASSFDSSLYPDPVNQTYPPTNAYMLASNHSLSPGLRGRNGQSISPSHSVDHLSPETGYLSDPSYQDLSTYATPNFNGQFLNESFSHLGFSENVESNLLANYQGEVDMSLLTNESLATYNAQPSMLREHAQFDSYSRLLSPHTNGSSPNSADEAARSSHANGLRHGNVEYSAVSTPASHNLQSQQATPGRSQQRSPALTTSPVPTARSSHLASPIVRVENYGEAELPSPSEVTRPVSKRSHGSRQIGNHLSPFPIEDSSGDEDEDRHQPVRLQPGINSQERNDDGSWLVDAESGHAGLGPDDRRAMGDAWVPTIEEIAEKRAQEEKKLDVQDWLAKSEVGSEADDVRPSPRLLKPVTTRRRAKSHNDVHRQEFLTNAERIEDCLIPGPGVYVDEKSEYGEYEDEDDDDDDELAEPESPPAAIELNNGLVDPGADTSYLQSVEHANMAGSAVRPWVDVAQQSTISSARYQPPTSNAAMMRFWNRAKDVESASLAATVGSRRLSESDLGSIRAAPGVVKAIEPDTKKNKEGQQRRPSFLGTILPKRTPSNLLKRKGSIPPQQTPESSQRENTLEKPKRMGSWGRPKSPRLDTAVPQHGKEGPPSASGLSASSGAWYQGAKNVMRRSRSRSDLGRSPGLKELMTQHGGPPMPMLASPLADNDASKSSPRPGSLAGDDDDDDAHETITMDLQVRSDPVIPTPEGFRFHAQRLNPRLPDYMVERITTEQTRRYKRLLEFKIKHLKAIQAKNCGSGAFCIDLGGMSKQLQPRAGNRDADATFIGFQVTAPGSSDDDNEQVAEGTVLAAAFPSGVPLPPVKRLPAEFECPLCFKVKKFYKPSDWTKHVHEDVQPFTCTFPNCGEPKSFKRKTTSYNILSANTRLPNHGSERPKQPRDEPCRFCGNICTSWKKLTVHLAKHMEQISMPILPLIEQRPLSADTIISPITEMPEGRKLSATPSMSMANNPSRYKRNSALAPGLDVAFGRYPPDTSVAPAVNVMHTYPPPQMPMYKAPQQQQAPQSGYAAFVAENPNASAFSGRTYPGMSDMAMLRGGATNNLQIPSPQYAPGTAAERQSHFPASVPSMMDSTHAYSVSPVDTAAFATTDAMGPAYFTQEPQALSGGELVDMGFGNGGAMPFQQPDSYSDLSYLVTRREDFQYPGQ